MPSSFKQSGLRIISGEDTSRRAGVLRGLTCAVEPIYAGLMRLRNSGYDRGYLTTHSLGRPTVSVGNITTGGTGKTPVVKWLADQLRLRGHHPGILLRGYAPGSQQFSDEAALLDQSLNTGSLAQIPVQANPSRTAGAAAVLQSSPQVDVFLLDDGFQHRRARRDFNLVLISATQPFGFGHVLPRGLLREPLAGLGRADAFLITRCSSVAPGAVVAIDDFLRDRHPRTPVFHADHHHTGIWIPATGETLDVQSIASDRVFLCAGIADPQALEQQVRSIGCSIVGTRWFPDHHAFSEPEVAALLESAKTAGADRLLITQKDWVKIKSYPQPDEIAAMMAVLQMEILFHEDEHTLLELITQKLASCI